MQTTKKNSLFLFFCGAYILIWLFFPNSLIASDPWAYSIRAFELQHNLSFYSLGNHIFDQRLGVTLPVATLYRIFGVSTFTTHLWSLICTLSIAFIIWKTLSTQKQKVIGVLLLFTCLPIFKNSLSLYPDLVITTFMSGSTLILFKRTEFAQRRFFLFYPILAAVFLFAGFLTKLSIYWILPLWIYYFAKTLREKDILVLRRFFIPAIATSTLLGLLYLSFSQLIWHDPLARFHCIDSLTGVHLWKFEGPNLIKRLTYQPLIYLITSFYALPIVVLLVYSKIPRELKPWGGYTLVIFFLFWFGSTSFSEYAPMPLMERMICPLAPGLIILASGGLSKIKISSIRNTVFLAILSLSLIFPMGIYFYSHTSKKIYAEKKSMDIFREYVLTHPKQQISLQCADPRSPEFLKFYFQYVYPPNLDVTYFPEKPDTKTTGFGFVNSKRSDMLERTYNFKKYDEDILKKSHKTIFEQNEILLIKYKKSTQ